MSCSIFNSAPFQAISFSHESPAGQMVQILLVKGTWALSSGRLAPPQRQAPIWMRDETVALGALDLDPVQRQVIAGREGQAWLRYESDLVPPKPRFDLIINAWVQRKGRTFFELPGAVDFQGQRLLSLNAFAPRIWGSGVLSPIIKAAKAPVAKVPAFNVFAFGGPANRAVAAGSGAQKPVAERKHWPANQDGMGYCTEAMGVAGVALPWLETPGRPIRQWNDRPPVAALGHASRADQPRRALQGTVNKESSALPADFDPRYYNAAPPELQLLQRPRPGDKVELLNLSRDGHCAFGFPSVTLQAMGEERGGRRHAPAPLHWDTLLIEPEEDRACLVWRAQLADPGRKLAGFTLMIEPGPMA
ncbi:MAG: DUF2169 domain-containing protein [Desulfovibrionaceae bacterium]|nr:DUF2169 domain-containing protein [Desulfovibrionaceae bacterium]